MEHTIQAIESERAVHAMSLPEFFQSVTKKLQSQGVIAAVETFQDRDFHLFLDIKGHPKHVIHVQAYPGFSDDERLCLHGRLMDKERMLQERAIGTSPGNEHSAVVRDLQSLPMRRNYSWDVDSIASLIASGARSVY